MVAAAGYCRGRRLPALRCCDLLHRACGFRHSRSTTYCPAVSCTGYDTPGALRARLSACTAAPCDGLESGQCCASSKRRSAEGERTHRTDARFLLYAKETFGNEAETLLEGLLEHGRLRLSQLILRAAARAKRAKAEVEESLQTQFVALVEARLVVHRPAAHLPCLSAAGDDRLHIPCGNMPAHARPGPNAVPMLLISTARWRKTKPRYRHYNTGPYCPYAQERVPSGCVSRPSELQIVPPIVAGRGRGAQRGGAQAAAAEASAIECAAQRAREESERCASSARLLLDLGSTRMQSRKLHPTRPQVAPR